ncbi:MAG: DUF4340 domain-containing protein [Anaerolineae bacterium]|nr:DUF4340 domain-containing protein [Anaerolineae bacterium]
MFKRSTLILILAFVIVFALAVLMDKSPQLTAHLRTPTPTAYQKLIPDWSSGEIAQLEIISSGQTTTLLRQPGQGWVLASSQKNDIDQSAVETLISKMISLDILSFVPDTSQEALGLQSAAFQITLRNLSGQQRTIRVGKTTPIGSGYYVALDTLQTPVVINKYDIDQIITILTQELITSKTLTP